MACSISARPALRLRNRQHRDFFPKGAIGQRCLHHQRDRNTGHPAGDSAVQVIAPYSNVTLNGQSLPLPAGDALQVSYLGGSIAVSATGGATVQLQYASNFTLPVSSATTITLPDPSASLVYSHGSGSGATAVTISSPSEFTINGANAPFNPATGLYTTTSYSANEQVVGTVASQTITWTTGTSGAGTAGAGGVLTFYGFSLSTATLATTLASGSSTYQLGGSTIIESLAQSDQLIGTFTLQGRHRG